MNWAIFIPIVLFGGLVIIATILGGKAIDAVAARRTNQK